MTPLILEFTIEILLPEEMNPNCPLPLALTENVAVVPGYVQLSPGATIRSTVQSAAHAGDKVRASNTAKTGVMRRTYRRWGRSSRGAVVEVGVGVGGRLYGMVAAGDVALHGSVCARGDEQELELASFPKACWDEGPVAPDFKCCPASGLPAAERQDGRAMTPMRNDLALLIPHPL